MAAHFSTEFIDEVLSRVDMMDLMRSHGIEVKAGAGNNNYYKAEFCCGKKDFENGRIKKSTQTYKCEACLSGGNPIHFLRNVVGMSFYDAVKELATIARMDLPVEDSSAKEIEKRKDLALRLTAEFYQSQNNYDYFLSRGISLDVLKKHKAGYAPGGRALRNHLEAMGFTKQELREYKLINQKGLDKFFYRAIIPIYMSGKVVDFYGRAVDEKHNSVKHLYLNGDVNFLGGYEHIQPGQLVTIYESYIDQLVAESHGIGNGTNPGGANKFTNDHVRLLQKKNITKAVIIYDGDSAGKNGALKTGEFLNEEGIEVWVGQLPEGEDPAKILLEQGKEKFVAAIDGIPFSQFKMYHDLQKYSLSDIELYLHEMKKKLEVTETR